MRRSLALLAAVSSVAGFMLPKTAAPSHIDAPRSLTVRGPIGVPKVAYRVPGAPSADWIDIYNRCAAV